MGPDSPPPHPGTPLGGLSAAGATPQRAPRNGERGRAQQKSPSIGPAPWVPHLRRGDTGEPQPRGYFFFGGGAVPDPLPWKSESLGTSIPARIQCSSGKEPATAAFRCSAPGGGRWGKPV